MLNTTNIDEKVLEIIAKSVPGKFRKTNITKETHLQKELGLDSIGVVSLVFRFEEAFSIDISQMDLKINVAKIHTVNDVLNTSREILELAEAAKHV